MTDYAARSSLARLQRVPLLESGCKCCRRCTGRYGASWERVMTKPCGLCGGVRRRRRAFNRTMELQDLISDTPASRFEGLQVKARVAERAQGFEDDPPWIPKGSIFSDLLPAAYKWRT